MQGTDRQGGFTLVELAVVVLIIGILVAIAVPVFRGANANSERKACWSNERVIEGAYQQYVAAEETAAPVTDWAELKASLIPSRISTEPHCPGGGSYSFNGSTVYCTVHDTYHDAN